MSEEPDYDDPQVQAAAAAAYEAGCVATRRARHESAGQEAIDRHAWLLDDDAFRAVDAALWQGGIEAHGRDRLNKTIRQYLHQTAWQQDRP